ncbi:MAG: DUF6088 family protein [Parabacteroides sp.]|jgi:hypothetical protein|nr:DUF6088 family protein [Parabacteroides sp.]
MSIESQIQKEIEKQGRGWIFFPADFSTIGQHKAVSKALERLTDNGQIIRLTRGIYYYPKIDEILGLGVLYPSIEEIAEGIARRDNARIVPTGIHALNKLGLSTQVPMNFVYMTDGSRRNIDLGEGKSIQFKFTSPSNLAFTNKLAMLATFALKELGKDNITDEQLSILKNVMRKETKENVTADASLMPAWIRIIIRSIYE